MMKVLALKASSVSPCCAAASASCPSCPKEATTVPARNKIEMNSVISLVFKSVVFYKDLVFSVFNIKNIKIKLNDKYRTKNINTDSVSVFFITINQIRAKNNSSRNLRLIDTKEWKVWLRESRDIPLLKIIKEMRVITEKHEVSVRSCDQSS